MGVMRANYIILCERFLQMLYQSTEVANVVRKQMLVLELFVESLDHTIRKSDILLCDELFYWNEWFTEKAIDIGIVVLRTAVCDKCSNFRLSRIRFKVFLIAFTNHIETNFSGFHYRDFPVEDEAREIID